jgi:hypothetical protein
MPRIRRARARILGGATRIGDPTTHQAVKGGMFSAYLPKKPRFLNEIEIVVNAGPVLFLG